MMACDCTNCADATEVRLLSEKISELEWMLRNMAQRLADQNEEALYEWI